MKNPFESPNGPAPETERTLESRKRIVRTALERGLENEDREIAVLHGTSLETVLEALRTGLFVGSTQGETARTVVTKGVPVFSAYSLRSPQARQEAHASDEDFEAHLADGAKGYAQTIGEEHFFLRTLQIRISKRFAFAHGFGDLFLRTTNGPLFDEEACRKFSQETGKAVQEIKAAVRAALTRKGVVIGLSEDLLKRFSTRDVSRASGDEDHEVIIECPNGIPVEYLRGVEPLTKAEWRELEEAIR